MISKPDQLSPSNPLDTLPVSRRGLLAGLTGFLALAACGEQKATPAPAEKQVATAEPTPSSSPSPEVIEVTPKKIDTPLESPLFQALPEKLQKSYLSMDMMKLDEFIQLPREQQLQYTDLTYRMVEDYTNAILRKSAPQLFTPEIAQLRPSLNNTDDEIIQLFDKYSAAGLAMLTQDGDLTKIDPNWQWRAKNYTAALYSSPDNPALNHAITVIDSAQSLADESYGGLLLGYTSNQVIKDTSSTQRKIVFTSDYYKTSRRSSVFTMENFTPVDASNGEESFMWSAGRFLEA